MAVHTKDNVSMETRPVGANWIPVAAATKIFANVIVGMTPGAAACHNFVAGDRVVGISNVGVDNLNGQEGDKKAKLDTPAISHFFPATDGAGYGSCHLMAYAANNGTVTFTQNTSPIGPCHNYDVKADEYAIQFRPGGLG